MKLARTKAVLGPLLGGPLVKGTNSVLWALKWALVVLVNITPSVILGAVIGAPLLVLAWKQASIVAGVVAAIHFVRALCICENIYSEYDGSVLTQGVPLPYNQIKENLRQVKEQKKAETGALSLIEDNKP